MTYTQGIRKVFDTSGMSAGSEIEDSFIIARHAGYEALSFNGLIYVYDTKKDAWQTTCFTLKAFAL